MQNHDFKILDVTLRDGNHALRHKLSIKDACAYSKLSQAAGFDYIEIGHGNGLGGSSLLIGESKYSDKDLIAAVRESVPSINLGVHVMPSFATIERDLKPALILGVNSFRIASHCSEADTTQKHLEFIRNNNSNAVGTLMMISHLLPAGLITEAKKMIQYGAESIIFMDSTGSLIPHEVHELIGLAVNELSVPIGFHAHNNLGLAVANSLEAVKSGAKTIDGSIVGLGAGAGNAQLELLVAAFEKSKPKSKISLSKVMRLAIWAIESGFVASPPNSSPYSALTGLNNLFSGFLPIIKGYAAEYNVDIVDLISALGSLDLVAGQEDQIESVARHLPHLN